MYKIIKLKNSKIDTIYAFVGSQMTQDNYRSSKMFSKEELKHNVIIVPDTLLIDDSIYGVKLKLANAIRNLNTNEDIPSFKEIYFFGQTEKQIQPTTLFEKYQKGGSIDKLTFYHIIRNIADRDIEFDDEKELYTHDDIMKIFNRDHRHLMNVSIGQSSSSIYCVDPIQVERDADETIQVLDQNSYLLLDFPQLVNNTLYAYFLEDVINKDSMDTIRISNYYPGLLSKPTKPELVALRKETETLLDSAEITFQKINVFHEIFHHKQSEIRYSEKGIKTISITIIPDYKIKVPLDVIFKLIHATQQTPLIKYNFSPKQDNLYRLYADKVTDTGEKIPYLPKSQIFKLMKNIGKTKSVAIYSDYGSYEFICEFNTSGNITLIADFEKPIPYASLDELNAILRNSMTPIHDLILPFFEQNGYRIAEFTHLESENVVINDITFQTTSMVDNIMNITDYESCVSSIFNIIFAEDPSKLQLRFKRVSRYRKEDAQRNFVLEHLKQKTPTDFIIDRLIKSFGLTESVATDVWSNIKRELEQEQQLNRRHKTVSEMPGFNTIVSADRISKRITFTVSGINNLHYLETIPIYIDSWIRLSQSEYTSSYPMENVHQICLGDYAEDIVIEEPIVMVDDLVEEEEDEEDDDSNKSYLQPQSDSDSSKLQIMSDSSSTSSGGAPKKAKEVVNKEIHNIDGMSLSHPYFFQQRMEDRAKTLFSSIKNDKFKSYSRMCPSSIRRQPVILNKEELEETRKNNPGEYESDETVLSYSSNKENQDDPESYYYVCPRYWCLKTNQIISEEDVKAGKCGKILPKNATKVIKDHYVYEFSAEEEHMDENGNYIKHFPGFHKNATENNKCIPCCYKKFSDKQIERRKQCEGVVENKDSGFSLSDKPKEPEMVVDEHYILGPEKFPLGMGRWGKLPISVQQFFNDIGSACKVDKKNKNKSSCLLRHGVEKNANKSFLSCIVDALHYAELDSNKEPMAITDVKTFIKNNLLKSFDLDSFLTLQNGTLYDQFAEPSNKSFNSVPDKYKTTSLYIKTDGESSQNKQFFMNVLNAYERFCDFLLEDSSYVDYTFLWDLICKPNPLLFVNGLNLIILNIPDSDLTTNVEFVCPTNHYSKEVYESRRRTLILVSREEMFEPVYEYKDIETKLIITKTFSEYDRYLSPGMRSVLTQIVKPLIKEHCKPNKLAKYEYKSPPLLEELIKTLHTRKYQVISQVMNLRGKVVGILAKDIKNMEGFIPCYPSSPNLQYRDVVYITDDIWGTYKNTLEFLKRWYKINKTAKKVVQGKCTEKDEICKVIDHGIMVGFLTNTNQFIQISDPHENMVIDNLRYIEHDNFLIADNAITTAHRQVDKQRVQYTKKIKLEHNFYSAFRSAVRILLNDYANLDQQQEIVQEIYNKQSMYATKIVNVVGLLRKLTKDRIRFIDDMDIDENEMVSTCLSIIENDKCSKNPACFYSHGNCGLHLPKKNLLTETTDNSELYYSRLADEMVRYNRINTFLFQRKNYLLFEHLGYNLLPNEIILLQSFITQQYFEGLSPSRQNATLMKSYDTANQTRKLRHPITFADIKHVVADDVRIPFTQEPVKYVALKQCLPTGSVEITYPSNAIATFQFVSDLIQLTVNEVVSTNELRDKLAELYSQYSDRYKIQIANILIQQGKKTFGSYIKAGTLEIKHMLYTEGYYITNLDLWLLFDFYKIPSILISHKPLLETLYNAKEFVIYVDQTKDPDKFIFVISSAIKVETPPSYKYVESNGTPFIPLDDLKESCAVNMLSAISSVLQIEDYIRSFKPVVTTKYVKKQPGFRDIPDPDEPDVENVEIEPVVQVGPKDFVMPNFGENLVSPVKAPVKRKYTRKVVNRHVPHKKADE
jgi:hypothetical protein